MRSIKSSFFTLSFLPGCAITASKPSGEAQPFQTQYPRGKLGRKGQEATYSEYHVLQNALSHNDLTTLITF